MKQYLTLAVCCLLLSACAPTNYLAPVSSAWRSTQNPVGVHVVRRGDTLYAIAWQYDKDYRDLARLNGLRAPYDLTVGQRIRISGSTPVVRTQAKTNSYRPKVRVTPKKTPPGKKKRYGFGEGLGRFIDYRKKPLLLATGLIVIAALFALPRIEKDVDWTLCLQKGSGPFHAEMLLRETFGGSLPIQILVEGDLRDPAILKLMLEIERRLEGVPGVSTSQSIAGLIAELNQVLNDAYTIPDDRQGVSNLWFFLEGRPLLDQLVSQEEENALIQAKLNTWHTAFLVAAVDSINRLLQQYQRPLVAIALNRVAPSIREKWLPIRREQMMRDFQLNLQRYGIELPIREIKQVVDLALNPVAIQNGAAVLTRTALAYLTGPEAEAELPFSTARGISRAIGNALARRAVVDTSQIHHILLEQVPTLPPEDIDWLARSLTALLQEQMERLQLQPALNDLQALIPADHQNNSNLRRDLKGTLWRTRDPILIAAAEDVARIFPETPERSLRPVNMRVVQTGLAPVLKRMEEELTPTQVESLTITMVLVIILLAFIFRSWVGGVLAVVPISLTILINFAVMGYLGIGLDSFTAMIASVAIGLGIDTDIHFISRFREEMKTSPSRLAALQRTLNTTGISIIINALAVGMGFLILLAAGGQHIRRFGGLTALTIFISALFTLTILPALLLTIQPRFLRQTPPTKAPVETLSKRKSG